MSPVDLDTAASKRVKELSRAAGFQICRITSALPLHAEQARYLHWLADGRQGTMQWMTRERALSSSDPTAVLPAATSVICLGMAYWAGRRRPSDPLMGKIARYAWGADYHAVMGERLEQLASELQFEFGGEHRWYVDTGPMMDKALAARSGLGWYGKNTNILTEQFGSFVLLGEIITTLDLPQDRPLEKGCGACRLCAVACPTGALGPDYAIDANKCISYLTIEHRGVIPIELRAAIGTWVFGCDICQDVCPPTMEPYLQSTGERAEWAKEVRQILAQTPAQMPERAYSEPEETRKPSLSGPLFPDGIRQEYDLTWLLTLTHEQYLEAFRGTAIRRAKVWMLRRNAAVALGNAGGESCVAPLFNAMNRDDHPIVRGHAAWALGRIRSRLGSEAARKALELALSSEIDEQVLREIKAALRPRDNVTAARG